jgi:hypothetical protein
MATYLSFSSFSLSPFLLVLLQIKLVPQSALTGKEEDRDEFEKPIVAEILSEKQVSVFFILSLSLFC